MAKAKKRASTAIPVPKEKVKSPVNLAGTPEGERLVAELKNPFTSNMILIIAALVVSIIVMCLPFIRQTETDDPFMVLFYLGLICLAVSVFYLLVYLKKIAAFNKFKQKKDHLLIWKYDDAVYDTFVTDMNALVPKPSTKQAVMTFVCITIMEGLMFFLAPAGGRWVIYLSAVLLYGTVFGLMYLAPRYNLEHVKNKPYCSIVDIDDAYVMGNYIQWMYAKCDVKKFPEECKTKLMALCIAYDGYRFGSRSILEYSALLPNTEDVTITEALQVGRDITMHSKARAEFDQGQPDFLTRFFRKSVGQSVPTFKGKNK